MNGSSWQEETEARFKDAQEKAEYHEKEAAYWTKLRESLRVVLELEADHRAIKMDDMVTVDPQALRSQSVRKALIEIGARNRGLLVVKDAVGVLIEARVYDTRQVATRGVYSTLGQSKSYFKKERPGIYTLTPRAEKQLTLVSQP